MIGTAARAALRGETACAEYALGVGANARVAETNKDGGECRNRDTDDAANNFENLKEEGQPHRGSSVGFIDFHQANETANA